VKVEDVATPLEFVVAVVVAVPLANVPLAPKVGAVNVTVTPLVGAPPVVTMAVRGAANGVLTVVLCGVPPVAAIVGLLTAVFVKLKLAVVEPPDTVAVTE
jgi:hypothetical protein